MTIAIDTETAPIEPGNLTPALTCLSYAYREITYNNGVEGIGDLSANVIPYQHVLPFFRDPIYRLCISGKFGKVVGCNIAYDMACIWTEFPELRDKIWGLYDAGAVSDISIRQKLIDIAMDQRKFRRIGAQVTKSTYGLAPLVQLYLGYEMAKENSPRLEYRPLRDVHMGKWPQGFKDYAIDDAVGTLLVYERQENYRELLDDEERNVRAAWALHLHSVVGLRTHPERVASFKRSVEEDIASKETELMRAGLLRPDGSRDTKLAKERMILVCNGAPKMTKGKKDGTGGGNVALDSDTCISTGDPLLQAYAEVSSDKKMLSTDIPLLEAGTVTPIQTRFEVLQATGRTGSGKGEDEEGDGNVQNIRRAVGIRECYIPPEGYVFIDCDYPMLELHTWAEICSLWLGFSRMAEVLKTQDSDPHLDICSQIMGQPIQWCRDNKSDKEVKHNRNCGKVANFGLPGGLGEDTFVDYAAKSYKVKLTKELAKFIKDTWKATWPEANPYFKFINACNGTIKLPYGGLIRSGMTFTSACNFPFQALGAVIAKHAAYAICRACFVEENSPLFGSLPSNFIHDQFLIATPDNANAHDAAQETARLMRVSAQQFLPHVGMRELQPCLCRMWSKDAEAVFDSNRRLVPWPLAS